MNQPADLQTRNAKRRIAGLPSGTGMKGSVELIYDAVAKNEYLYFNQYGLYRSAADAGEQDFAKLVKASGSECTKIATAGNFGDLRRNVLLTGEAVYMASENSAAVNSDLKLPAVGSLGAAAGQASYLPSQPFRTAGASGQGYTRSLGRKVYELTDHLGNVHATVSDRRIYDATLKASLPEVQSLADYYPFGMQMPGKKLNPDRYRYGFNGKERETGFGSDSYDFGARVYNSLTGKWVTPDPLASKYPSMSPYCFAGNNPIYNVDPDGRTIRVYITAEKFYDYTPGIAPADKSSIQYKVHQAIEYNMNTEVGKEVWNTLHKAEEVIEIKSTKGGSEYNGSTFGEKTVDGKTSIGIIYWNIKAPVAIYSEIGVDDNWFASNVKGYFSPSTVFVHEGGHALEALRVFLTNDPEKIAAWKASDMENNGFGDDYQYDTKEERRNIENVEFNYLKQINAWEQSNSENPQYQPVRYNHKGTESVNEVDNVNKVYSPSKYKIWKAKRQSEGIAVDDGTK